MTTETDRPTVGPDRDQPHRPPLVAMVVVGLVMAATLFALFRSGSSATEQLLDEDEVEQPAGTATFELGSAVVTGELDHDWIRRERCPGWIQLNSLAGDATTVHLVVTDAAPDLATRTLVEVDDLPGWWADAIDVTVEPSRATTLLDTPAVEGPLVDGPDAPEEGLLVACREADGSAGSGIRGPAGGFTQYAVATTAPVPGVGTVLVLGAAWVGGDPDLARDEAARLGETLRLVEP